jgi:hypothetical protein
MKLKSASKIDPLVRPLAQRLHANHMAKLGIRRTMKLAYAYNRFKFGRLDGWRRELYKTDMDELLKENGGLTRPRIQMKDGWALDTSKSLPHLERVLEDSDKIIAERCGVRLSAPGKYRSYFQDVWTPADLEKYPSFLDFTTSSDVLAPVADYLNCIPTLSTTLPSGIRFVESNAAFDDQPGKPHDSQLYHIDYYSLPNVYVLVLLRDTTPDHGPWTFLPKSHSAAAARKLSYWTRQHGYRLSDEQVYAEIDRKNAIEFCGQRGDVLYIESSGCFHYGSRNSVKPRFQLMLGYLGVCRTDFSELIMPSKVYPARESDSRLRKMVLNKNLLP